MVDTSGMMKPHIRQLESSIDKAEYLERNTWLYIDLNKLSCELLNFQLQI